MKNLKYILSILIIVHSFLSLLAAEMNKRVFVCENSGKRIVLYDDMNKLNIYDEWSSECTVCDIVQRINGFFKINSSNWINDSIRDNIRISQISSKEEPMDSVVIFIHRHSDFNNKLIKCNIISLIDDAIIEITNDTVVSIPKTGDESISLKLFPTRYPESNMFGQYLSIANYDIPVQVTDNTSMIEMEIGDVDCLFTKLYICNEYIRIVNDNVLEWNGEVFKKDAKSVNND